MILRLLSPPSDASASASASARLAGVRLARKITGYLRLCCEPQTPRQVAAWLNVGRETAEELLCVMADAGLLSARWDATGTRVVFALSRPGGMPPIEREDI